MFSSDLGWSGFLVLLLLSAWFLISIPNQFTNRFGAWVQKINVYGFIPGWTFFAPTPGTVDYRLFYRDISDDNTVSAWEEVNWCKPRMPADALWHPRRYATKLVVDSINGLALVFAAMKKEGIDVRTDQNEMLLSTPYVILLNVVMAVPPSSLRSTARQMALFIQEGGDFERAEGSLRQKGRLMLCSIAHRLQ